MNSGDFQYATGDVVIGGNLVVAGTVNSSSNSMTAATGIIAVNGTPPITATTSNGVVALTYTGATTGITAVNGTGVISVTAPTTEGVVEVSYTGSSGITAVNGTGAISVTAPTTQGVVDVSFVGPSQFQAIYVGPNTAQPYPSDTGYGLQMQTGSTSYSTPEVATWSSPIFTVTCQGVSGWISVVPSSNSATELQIIPPDFDGQGITNRPAVQLIVVPMSSIAARFNGFVEAFAGGYWAYASADASTIGINETALFYYEWRNLYKVPPTGN